MTIIILRLLCLATWGALGFYLAPSAIRAFRGVQSSNDPWRAGLFFVCLLVVAFNGRHFVAPNSEDAYALLHLLGIACGAYIWKVVRAYGRGK